ncbi:hypothetical protein [uncultured Litoreibacter sp.]|uniref:hypothetical protein n=1 Tax=uncultured Litoreibacter sp. TaxID=1392394 RepID=UPI0026082C1A|nr:hypothetical protein [uncultured Litoreibacter sp.]
MEDFAKIFDIATFAPQSPTIRGTIKKTTEQIYCGAVMKNVMIIGALAMLAACGVPANEDISSKSDFKPLGQAFFVPVNPAELAQSQAWAEVVESYQ